MKRTEPDSDLIQLFRVNNLIPMIGVIVSVTIFIVKSNYDAQLIIQRLDAMNAKIEEHMVYTRDTQAVMRSERERRDSQIASLNVEVAKLKQILSIPDQK